MPKISDHQDAGIRRSIRDAMAIDPLISLRSLQQVLEKKHNRLFALTYLMKIVRKVTSEMTVVADREKYEERIMQLRERNRVLIQGLMNIGHAAMTSDKDKVAALRAIAQIENAQVKLEMDLGLFTRKIGEIDLNHRLMPLDDATRAQIIQAFNKWGSRTVEARKINSDIFIVKPTNESNNTTNIPAPVPTTTVNAIRTIPSVTGAGLVISE